MNFSYYWQAHIEQKALIQKILEFHIRERRGRQMKVCTSQVNVKNRLALVTVYRHHWCQGPRGQAKAQRSLRITS